MKTKRCVYCLQEKEASEKFFPRHAFMKDRLDTRCKECVKKNAKIRKKLALTHGHLKSEKCACCGKTHDRTGKPLQIVLDHDHETGEFRGYVCKFCNLGIGHLGDNMEGLQTAMKYLKSTQNRPGKI